mgnify:CR=1 FL=1
MYDVKGNLHEVLGSLPAGVRLVAISKFHPNEYIEEAYAEGQRIFGESRNSPRRWLRCLRTSSGISLVICRPIR